MSDIELACHMAPWGTEGIISALDDIEKAGYRGIEMTAEVVEVYEDRVTVFTEILSQHRLNLVSITTGGKTWPGMNLDEEVERCLNVARFLKTCGADCLTLLPPRPNPEHPVEDELDLMPAATAYGEIARRSLEQGVKTCLCPQMGTFIEDTKTLGKFIQLSDSEAVKLCVDIGWLAEADISIKPFIKEHRSRIGLVHLRDFKKTRRKKGEGPVGVELGKGALDLDTFVDELLKIEYSGWATIRFDDAKNKSLYDLAVACHKFAENNLDLVL